jgi:heme exporter protein D
VIKLFLMNGYGLFVWSAFAFTLINFFTLYIIINRQLIKENKKFELKFNHLEKIKYKEAHKQRTNQVLVSGNAAQKI